MNSYIRQITSVAKLQTRPFIGPTERCDQLTSATQQAGQCTPSSRNVNASTERIKSRGGCTAANVCLAYVGHCRAGSFVSRGRQLNVNARAKAPFNTLDPSNNSNKESTRHEQQCFISSALSACTVLNLCNCVVTAAITAQSTVVT